MRFENAKVTIDYNELQDLIETAEETSVFSFDLERDKYIKILERIENLCGDKPEFKEIKKLCCEGY